MSLADRIAEALAVMRPGTPEFHEWEIEGGDYAPAAVLVAITDRADPGVLLTVRNASMRRHAGQIAFPGGRVDPGDADVIDAALREAEEEIGIARAAVSVVGLSDAFRIGSGFEIVPVIGIVPPGMALTPNEAEVAEVFEAPLAFLTDPVNHVRLERDYRGRPRGYHEIVWRDRQIWGATAAIIVNLARRLGRLA